MKILANKIYKWFFSIILIATFLSFSGFANNNIPHKNITTELVVNHTYKKATVNYVSAKQHIIQQTYHLPFFEFTFNTFLEIPLINSIRLLDTQNKNDFAHFEFNLWNIKKCSSKNKDDDYNVFIG